MSFSIVKVRSSLNYSLIGLKIKNIYGGIKDKMEEIQLKYIETYCANCYYFHGPRRIRDTTNLILFIDLKKLIMQQVPVQRATDFLCSIKNAVILRVPVQRALL